MRMFGRMAKETDKENVNKGGNENENRQALRSDAKALSMRDARWSNEAIKTTITTAITISRQWDL